MPAATATESRIRRTIQACQAAGLDITAVEVAADGTVSGKTGQLGRIAVTVFPSEAGVTPRGDGLMTATGGRELPAAETKLRSGGVEGSNVQPISETADMVEILRAYQSSQQMSQSMTDMRRKAIDQLGKIG